MNSNKQDIDNLAFKPNDVGAGKSGTKSINEVENENKNRLTRVISIDRKLAIKDADVDQENVLIQPFIF